MNETNHGPVATVEAYAELVARLGGDEERRAATLAAHGLTEAAWLAADARWRELLGRRDDPSLADRFCTAYREALLDAMGGAPTDRAPPPEMDHDVETREMEATAPAMVATPPPSPTMYGGMRLVRFDPQTGRPLPRPLWVPLNGPIPSVG